MEILLINPLLSPKRQPSVYNIGLGYIATSLLDDGFKVSVLDIEGYRYQPKRVLDFIKKANYDAIGIGTLITGYKYTKWLTSEIRKINPNAKIWMGNSIATTIPEIILNDMPVDVVVRGEGEATIKELARAGKDGKDLSRIEGISFKSNGTIVHNPDREIIEDIDTIPMPAWDLFPQDIYMNMPSGALPVPTCYILTTRGCPFNCTYCYHPYQNKKIRSHSAQRVVDEVGILKNKFKINSFTIADDLFISNKERVYEICDLMRKKKLGLKWACAGRVNMVDEDILKAMKDAGCVNVGFGIESINQKVLDNIKKQVTVEQTRAAVSLCLKVGLESSCSYMIGNIGETRATVLETASFIMENLCEPTTFFITTPYPGTELYEYGIKTGKIKDEIALFEAYGEQADNLLVNFTEMSNEELLALKREAEAMIWKQCLKSRYLEITLEYLKRCWKVFVLYCRQYGLLGAIKRAGIFLLKRFNNRGK